MKAKVYKSTGSWYVVKSENGELLNARVKGVFKIDQITSTNPLSVGDNVEIDIDELAEKTAIIHTIAERRNYINRQSPSHVMQQHIIASNIDQSLLFATLKEPRTSQGFIDRFLVACEAYHVPAMLVFNKSDLYRGKELDKFEVLKSMYEKVGYAVFLASIREGRGVDELKAALQHNISLLSGHSGTGKSSFINAIFPEFHLKTQEISGWSGKGIHTTTFAEMFDLPFGGQIIDTPGMREFGLIGISKQELSHYFPEMLVRLHDCQFNNCLHLHEPGCAVKIAVQQGAIHEFRYDSYCNILESLTTQPY